MEQDANKHKPELSQANQDITATLPTSGFGKIPFLSPYICSLRDSRLKGGSMITLLIWVISWVKELRTKTEASNRLSLSDSLFGVFSIIAGYFEVL